MQPKETQTGNPNLMVIEASLLSRGDGALQAHLVWELRGAMPPAKDNPRAADFLCQQIGSDSRAW